jgi:hypothetical protein
VVVMSTSLKDVLDSTADEEENFSLHPEPAVAGDRSANSVIYVQLEQETKGLPVDF